jgi:hypothetical protein
MYVLFVILKMNSDYSPNNDHSLDNVSLHPSLVGKLSEEFPFSQMAVHIRQENHADKDKRSFFFQTATEGIESAVYKKLIAPFKNDMPVSGLDAFRRVCDDHNYAYIGSLEQELSCQVVPLPETFYTGTAAYIISKNNPYRGLIIWR